MVSIPLWIIRIHLPACGDNQKLDDICVEVEVEAAEIAHDIGATQHRKPVPNVFHFTQKNPTPR